ncbi:mitogen-activated protein kinase pmk-1-like [Convolutriloba macropyga]|uniref:mitogen-activated protein kinase pmk-1-like n=1 Tax=Convolutriloba macropyga TaxID=536237 RepID=UPI003F51FE52
MDEIDGAINEPVKDNPRSGYTLYSFNRQPWIVKNKYDRLEPLNVGAFGAVCRATDLSSGQDVAIKRLNQPFQHAETAKRALRELRLLKFFQDHENLLTVVDAFTAAETKEQMDDLYFVTVLMQADLSNVLRSDEMLSAEHVMFFLYQIIRGLKFLHSAGIIHRDLKPANIAVNEDSMLKIIDYGLSRSISADLTGYVVTRYYRAPEVMYNFEHYDEKVDMWSVGCIFAEMLTGETLFPAEDHVDLLNRIVTLCGKPSAEEISDYISNDIKEYLVRMDDVQSNFDQHFAHVQDKLALDLLKRMLVINPSQRISVQDCLKHPYFESLHDETDEPSCDAPFHCSDFEGKNLTVDQYKDLIWKDLQAFQTL